MVKRTHIGHEKLMLESPNNLLRRLAEEVVRTISST
jgi:hypothetical protein